MILPWSQSLEQQWDAYCDDHPLAWLWHRSGWMRYCASRQDVLNLSFAVIADGEIVGICPIIHEGNALLYDSGPCPEPLYDSDIAKRELFAHLRSVMDAYRIDHYDFRGSVDDIKTIEMPWKTRIVDLQHKSDMESIHRWRNVRKSYKSLIHNAQATHRIEKSIDPRDVAILHALHTAQAGRETRPQQTWDLMAAFVHTGHAYLCTALNSAGVCAGAIYVYSYKDREYYGHAATTVDNLNHALVWEAIRTSDADKFEMGWQGHAASKKEASIEFFRRGFGGADHTFYVSRMYA